MLEIVTQLKGPALSSSTLSDKYLIIFRMIHVCSRQTVQSLSHRLPDERTESSCVLVKSVGGYIQNNFLF